MQAIRLARTETFANLFENLLKLSFVLNRRHIWVLGVACAEHFLLLINALGNLEFRHRAVLRLTIRTRVRGIIIV